MEAEKSRSEKPQEPTPDRLDSYLEAEEWTEAVTLLTNLSFLSGKAMEIGSSIGITGSRINRYLQEQIDRIPEDIRAESQRLSRVGGSLAAGLEMHYVRGVGHSDPKASCNECSENTIVHGDKDLGGVDDYDNYFAFCSNCLWATHEEVYNSWGQPHGIKEFDYASNTYRHPN